MSSIFSTLIRTISHSTRLMSTEANKAKWITDKVERLIYEQQLIATQTYFDIDLSDVNASEVVDQIKQHSWVAKTYLLNGSLRVFPFAPAFPAKREWEDKNVYVSRQGESHELPESHYRAYGEDHQDSGA